MKKNIAHAYATASDTLDIDELVTSLDESGANSNTACDDAYDAMAPANDDMVRLRAA